MKRIISSLGVALACMGFAHTANAQMPFEYSTAASPKWYVIKSAMLAEDGSAGYATDKVFQAKGMGKNVTFANYNSSSFQMFRFEQIAGQDSFKIINKKFPNGCLLSEGPTASVDKMYGEPKAEYVAWALETLADQGNGVQYRIVAEDGMTAKGEDGVEAPAIQILHAQLAGTVIVSWDAGYNSASAWTFAPATKDEAAIDNFIGDMEIALGNADGNIGTGVGQYPQAAYDVLYALYEQLMALDPDALSDDEFFALCDNAVEGIENFKNSRGQVQPYLPQVSTAENPIWYVLRSEATDGRNGRVLGKHEDRFLRADETFSATNNNQFWRVEMKDGYYTLINKGGGAVAGTMQGSNFVTTENQDTTCFDFKIVSPDPFNANMNTKFVALVNKSGQPFHQGNGGYDWKVITYGLTDHGSFFSFIKAEDLISTPIEYSTEQNPVWYYIKGKRQADALTNSRPYLTSFGETDTIYTRTNSEGVQSQFTYRVFARPESILKAAGDSAMWRFEEVTINEMSLTDPAVTTPVKKTLIINKLTGKCLNAFNHGNSKTIRFVGKAETGDTVFPYWDAVDKTMDMWGFRSRQVTNIDGTPTESVTYANLDNGPGLVLYNGATDPGCNYWLEKVEGWEASTPETSVNNNIKVFVNEGKIVVSGSDATPSVFTITGSKVDANKKLAEGVYVVKVGGKSAKVVVTK